MPWQANRPEENPAVILATGFLIAVFFLLFLFGSTYLCAWAVYGPIATDALFAASAPSSPTRHDSIYIAKAER